MNARDEKNIKDLPQSAQDFIKLIIKKMRYRKSVRRDVRAELTAHFEDELRDCADSQQKEQKAKELIENFGDAKLLGILLRRAKKRCRPLWRTIAVRTFQTIGVLVAILILYCVYISMGRPTVKVDYVKEMTELVRPDADESLNAANLYNQAVALYKEPPQIEVITDANEEISSEPADVEATGKKQDLLDVIRGKTWTDELTEIGMTKLEGWVQDNSQAIDLYIQGSKKPYCWWQYESDVNSLFELSLPKLKPMRDLSKLVCWRSKLKTDRGDIEGAFQDIFAVHRVGGHFKGPRTLVEQLVGIAIQALAVHSGFQIIDSTELNERTLENIQNEFQLLVDKATFDVDFTVEKFLMLDFIQRSYTDNGRGSGRMTPAGLQKYYGQDEYFFYFTNYWFALGASLVSSDREKITKMAEDAYGSFDESSKFTPWQNHQKCDVGSEFDIGQWSRIKRVRYWPVATLLPAIGQVYRIAHRIETESQAFLTVLALQRYQRQNGNCPETLDVLVQTKLLKELPMDPFSNTTLIYRRTDGDFILYSYGENLKDDSGKVHRSKGGRVQLWDDEEGDAVFWPVQK